LTDEAPPQEKPEEPILVVQGVGNDRIARARKIGCGVVILVIAGTLIGGSYAFPAFRGFPRFLYLQIRLVIIVGMAGAYVAERFVRPRAGRVEFYPDRIVLLKLKGKRKSWYSAEDKVVEQRETVAWAELSGFRDGDAEYVALLRKGGGSSFLTVPTLTEADRVEVLKLLDEHGVPRIE